MIDTVLAWNHEAVPDKFDELAHAAGVAGGGAAFVPWLKRLKAEIGIEGGLSARGVKAEHLPRIFELMFTTKPDGHGFGLSTSFRTVENHGGSMNVESPAGSGAVFTVELPVVGPGARR